MFPDSTNTGVPDGTTLTESGSLTVTTAGTVLDGLHVTGRVFIKANNVTMRRCKVDGTSATYGVQVFPGFTGFLIEDSEVSSPTKVTNIGIYFQGGGTIRCCDIHTLMDGVRFEADGVCIELSFIHDLYFAAGAHQDCLQIRKGNRITIRHNHFDATNATLGPNGEKQYFNSCIQNGSLLGTDLISDSVIEDNLFNAGGFTIHAGGQATDGERYRRNRFGRDYQYGIVANLNATYSDWDASNVFDDTGLPVL